MLLEPHEELDAIFAGEAAREAVAMLVDPGGEVGGHTRVERAVSCGCQQIGRGREVFAHFACLAGFPLSRE